MEVHTLSKKLVKPSTPTPQNLRNFKISFLDQFVPTHYIHVILYYNPEYRNDNINGDYGASIVDRRNHLEHSLSEILTLYYPLAGRYQSDKLLVECNDNGAEFSEAKVKCKLSQVLNGELDVEQLDSLVPSASESEATPLLLVQFNVFECGGTAIGVSMSHRLADAFTLSAFVIGWATACRERKISKVPRPNFQISSVFPAKHTSISVPETPSSCKAKDVTKRFVFTGEAIRCLKAQAAGDDDETKKFSRIEVVSALIWKALIQTGGQLSTQSMLIHTINLRQKVPIPLPLSGGNFFQTQVMSALICKALILAAQVIPGQLGHSVLAHILNLWKKVSVPTTSILACGNLFGMSIAKYFSADDDDDEDRSKVQFLHDLASQLHNTISSSVMEFAKFSNADDAFLKALNCSLSISEAYLNHGEVYLFSSWCRFPLYEANFGWGRPSWVSVARILWVNSLYVLDCKHGEGIEVWVRLEKNRMQLFQQNLEIVGIASQESHHPSY